MLLGSLTLAALAHAQPQPPAGQPSSVQMRFDELPVQLQLGVRVAAVQQGVPVAPVVVVVPDDRSYAAALALWSPQRRFPVLIDDGTPTASEDIARFVRAFRPDRVLLWSAPGGEGNLPEDQVRAAAERLAAGAVGLDQQPADAPALIKHLQAINHTPFGVVVTHESDSAWVAAVALAAARAQPILWIEPPARDATAWIMPDAADRFLGSLESGVKALGLPWDATGDALESVTICLNTPGKVQAKPDSDKEMVALTDAVGRSGRMRDLGQRWAWSGHILGSRSAAAYRAMCALFVHPEPASGRAWLFDGYRDQGAFTAFDATKAADVLRQSGWNATLFDAPTQGDDDWLRTTTVGIDADLVMVNTSGNWDFFDLNPGRCRPVDVPTLARPAAVYFVHSWSAQVGPRRDSISGRWLEHGAYAYVGSVQEPFLQAFMPTPAMAARMLSGAPWAASARIDAGEFDKPWRVAVFGDPLLTFSPRAPRSAQAPELDGATDLAEAFRKALQDEKFETALRTLALLGRDGDAAKLARALLADKPDAITPPAAAAALMPLFRTGDADSMLRIALKLHADPGSARIENPSARDALWHAVHVRASSITDQPTLYLLRTNIRFEHPARDLSALAPAWANAFGRPGVVSMLQDLRDGGRITGGARKELDSLIHTYRR